MHTVAHIHKKVEYVQRVFHLYIKFKPVGHIPPRFVYIALLCIIDMVVTRRPQQRHH